MSVAAGDLRWIALIESPPVEVTDSGEPDQDQWVTVATRRVKVEETTGGTKVSDGTHQKQSVAWFNVTLRLIEGLNPDVRLTITGRPFSGITMYAQTVSSTLEETTLLCVQRSDV